MFSGISGLDLFSILIIMLFSVSAHEAMHAFAAHWLGDSTAKDEGRLTLNPLKHVDIITTVLLPVVLLALHLPPIFIAKPVPFDPDRVRHGELGAALVGLAGPFTNLALAVIGSVVVRLMGLDLGISAVGTMFLFIQINIALFVFNMIPLPPLDGSRLLYAFAPEPLQNVMIQLERAGFTVTILIFLVLSPFIMPFIRDVSLTIFNFLI